MLGHVAQSLGGALPGASFGGFDLRNLQFVTTGSGTQGNLTITGHQAGDLVLVIRTNTAAPALDPGFVALARFEDANQTTFKHQLLEYIFPTSSANITVNQSSGLAAYLILRGARPVQAVLKSNREGTARKTFPAIPGFKRGNYMIGFMYNLSSPETADAWMIPISAPPSGTFVFVGNRCRLAEFSGAAAFTANTSDTISGAIEVELA